MGHALVPVLAVAGAGTAATVVLGVATGGVLGVGCGEGLLLAAGDGGFPVLGAALGLGAGETFFEADEYLQGTPSADFAPPLGEGTGASTFAPQFVQKSRLSSPKISPHSRQGSPFVS